LGRARSYPTHLAVDNVSLDIRAGERVAFIGRNGAGKSTLLKLITGVIEPTSGTVNVTGATHALLQMGAGFHPEFTGRQNAVRYLATLGLSDDDLTNAVAALVEFSELEEYIDQPLKTYSTGMQMRLIFAASTTIAPKLFVVDEVLGVGDAYFQQKSFSRLEELCNSNQTTLILVSHDIYSSARLCDRIVWLDRGRIEFDGEPFEAIRRYEASIRLQEERRLVKRHDLKEQSLESQVALSLWPQEDITWNAQDEPQLAFASLRVRVDKQESALRYEDVEGLATLEESQDIDGRPARRYRAFGTALGLVYATGGWPEGSATAEAGQDPEVSIEVYATRDCEIRGELTFRNRAGQRRYVFRHHGGGWQWINGRSTELNASPHASVGSRFGLRSAEIVSAEFLDADDQASSSFDSLSVVQVRITLRLNDPDFADRPTLVVAFQREDTLRTHRFVAENLDLRGGSDQKLIEVKLKADPLLVAPGNYAVSVSLFGSKHFTAEGDKRFFSVSSSVLDSRPRYLQIEVKESHESALQTNVVFFQPVIVELFK
jgi:ABC-type polysaccharide/polyol phosphate transport system ATPase subunit